jgi:hypothetical protein
MADHEQTDVEALTQEIARLRAENEQLRSQYDEPEPEPPAPEPRRVRVLLIPDPVEHERPGSKSLTKLADIALGHLITRSDVEWRATGDLASIPDGAECFQLGQVLTRMFDGSARQPMTFRVEQGDDGQRHLQRCLVRGEPDSDDFSAGYEARLGLADELLAEGKAALDAGADHHAGWAMKAIDVVLAELTLALASFQAGRDDWRDVLARARPEYDPQYRIEADRPVGW